MAGYKLSELEEYRDAKFLRKEVHHGMQSEVALLHLLPGQEVPTHPHVGMELVLVPQKGEGVLTVDGSREVPLIPGSVYCEGEGHTFRIQNRGSAPFQMLATLVRIGPESAG